MEMNNSLLIHQFKRQDYEYHAEDFLTGDGTWDRGALLHEARRQAKAMNQRLLRLEQAGMTNSAAYQGALKALSGYYDKTGGVSFGHITEDGRPRYKESVSKLSNEELRHLLYATSKTSQAKTSTVGTVNKLYAKGLENLNAMAREAGIPDFSAGDIMAIFRNKAFAEVIKTYGYKAVLQAVSDSYNELDLQEDVEDANYKIEQLANMITGYVDKFGHIPENLTELRKLLGAGTPEFDDDLWISAR